MTKGDVKVNLKVLPKLLSGENGKLTFKFIYRKRGEKGRAMIFFFLININFFSSFLISKREKGCQNCMMNMKIIFFIKRTPTENSIIYTNLSGLSSGPLNVFLSLGSCSLSLYFTFQKYVYMFRILIFSLFFPSIDIFFFSFFYFHF